MQTRVLEQTETRLVVEVKSDGKMDPARKQKADDIARKHGFDPNADYAPMEQLGSQPDSFGTGRDTMSPTPNNGRPSTPDKHTEQFVYDKNEGGTPDFNF